MTDPHPPPLPRSTSGLLPIEVAQKCAGEARRLMRNGFGRTGVTATKGRGNVLTETDLAIDAAVAAMLRSEYPAHALMSEESAATTRSGGWMWVVDPLDGTKNFSRGIPHFCFSIALCHDDQPVVALTLQPLLDEEFAAVLGHGSTLNGRPMTVSDCPSVQAGIVALDLGYDEQAGRSQLELALHLFPGMQSLRVCGSAALGIAYVAAARWDLWVHLDLEPWDLAAGLLLVREAGGIVTNLDGQPAGIRDRAIVAAPPAVHADFLALAAQLRWRA